MAAPKPPNRPIAIIGAGGHGRVVADALRLSGSGTLAGFIDPSPLLAGATVAGRPVLGGDDMLEELHTHGIHDIVIGVGSVGPTTLRHQLRLKAERAGLTLVTVCHPTAIMAGPARIGDGTVVCAGAIIGLAAVLGRNVLLNTGAILEHDCTVGDDAHIASGAVVAGGSSIGTGVHIGAGATVCQGVHIGDNAVVGAGAVVLSDVPAGAVVVGVPAAPVRTRQDA